MKTLSYLCIGLVVLVTACYAPAGDKLYKEDGLTKVHPPKVDEKFRNTAWTEKMEKGFWKRANHAIDAYTKPSIAATTGEHEKWNYPKLMFNYLAGQKAHCLKGLQVIDGEQSHTAGIDFYWCFTLKNQMRKYFYFGDELDPSYKRRMYNAAKVWTKEDPRPTMELVLALDSKDEVVREYALELLQQMRVPPEKMKEMGKKAAASDNNVRKAFGNYMLKIADEIPEGNYRDDVDKWRQWYKIISDGDWMVFEEFERQVNPRGHPKHGVGSGPVGGAWDPGTRGGWVDARNTDNLRAMRECSVYLFAEETGNEKVRRLYKQKLIRSVTGLYHVGMGEWDSEAYHAHSIAPYLNLYDFAKDEQVKLLGKAALDWLFTAGALKYYRGGHGGPVKRDYGGANKPFGAGVSHMMYLYFGDTPMEDPSPHYDDVHAITSAYRPPLAVVGVARKEFDRPLEMHNTKPTYSHWLPGKSESPEFWETLYFGDTCVLGSVVSKGGAYDVGPFKMMAWDADRGVEYFVAASSKKFNTKRGGDQIAQYENLCLFLRPADGSTFHFQIPKSVDVSEQGGVWFVRFDKTYLAIRPIGLDGKKLGGMKGRDSRQYPKAQLMTASGGKGDGLIGFAMEIGEAPTKFEDFRKAVLAKGQLSAVEGGKGYELASVDGRKLKVIYNRDDNLPELYRDGEQYVWMDNKEIYKPMDGGDSPVSLGWKEGKLIVKAGGYEFVQTVTKDGKVTFSEKKAK